jgi:DNA-binding response OmpR family regulator
MRLLVVEDDSQIAEQMRRALEEEGYSVLVASDGCQGLQMAESCEPDGIILDVMLPKMGGSEVVRRLRRDQNMTPILMVARGDTVPSDPTYVDGYLIKPFSRGDLVDRVRAMMRRHARPRNSA